MLTLLRPVSVAQLQPKDYIRQAIPATTRYSESEALDYTHWLATHHYENFHVVSFLLPGKLHQDFYNVYSFCRWADDLGDEIGDPEESLRLLAWWRDELQAMYAGNPVHPVFVALKNTVQRHDIPIAPFDRLIRAFEQDQTVTRYRTMDQVLDYCVYSANPVGHLVLYLCGYRDTERQRLSDYTCTALQLANHWQDVTVDLLKDRVYLPLELLDRYGYPVNDLLALKFDDRFRSVMRAAVDVADKLFSQGLPLIETVNRRLALDLELFSRGGMKVLDKIKSQDYDVLQRRPHISKKERVTLLLRCLPRLLFHSPSRIFTAAT
jgi:squalene synthase HpnC